MNLIEGLQQEMNRCRELLKEYESVGPAGVFASTMIKAEISKAESMISIGDAIGIMQSLEELKRCN